MSGTVLGFVVLYFAVVLGIGFWAMGRGAGDDLEGYLLGGRKIGPLVTALTLQSTAMSGSSLPLPAFSDLDRVVFVSGSQGYILPSCSGKRSTRHSGQMP